MYIESMIQDKPLTVYSASAGSGKTFSLVQEYLGLTIAKSKGAGAFKHVIAMTFTNKAAWEMKSRIIEALDMLSHLKELPIDKQGKANNIMDQTVANTGLSPETIKRNAEKTLSEILHNYEEFHVMTIDKFSLRLIRTFNKDLELPEDFEVVLDEKEIIEQVVDELLSKVGKIGNEQITKITVKYAKTNLDEGNKWNFRQKLIEFAEVLTKETEQGFIHSLLKKDFNDDDYAQIQINRRQVETEYEKAKKELKDYFEALNSVPGDYPQGKKGIYGQLDEINARELSNLKPVRKYTLQTISGEIVKEKHNIDSLLLKKTADFFAKEKELSTTFYFYKTLQKNFFDMALLKYLYKEFSDYKERNNVIGISEFGTMIAKLLNKESALYIYERLGTRFHHFLLDEFQDTSRLQWMNLIPLVEDSIANNRKNLIVGDPKQAIYRFRDGLVEQFVSLPGIYNPENDPNIERISQQFKALGEKKPLDANYRSKKEVVEFNNAFFKTLIDQLPPHFSAYYSDIKQEPKGSNGGYVNIERYDEKNGDSYKKHIDEFVVNKVRKSLSDGYQPGDICILVKGKKLGRHLARVLAMCEEQFKVISADSLSVDADKTVQFVIDYFKLRRNSSNKTAQMKFATSYFRVQGKDPVVEMNAFWEDGKIGRFNFSQFVDENFGGEPELFMGYENMFDLGQKLVLLMRLNMLRNPYLHHLMEILQQYDLRFGPDLRSFLEYWESTAHKENIQLPENDQAIKLMTIHKSKGLEFPVVILPDLTWTIDPHRKKQFFEVDDELLHVNLSGKNVPDYVESSYIEEYEQILLDQLNLLYVAFTRAEDRIYALTDNKGKRGDRYSKLSQLIDAAIPDFPKLLDVGDTDEAIHYGKEVRTQKEGEVQTGFVPEELHDFLWFPEISLQDDELKEEEVLSDDQRFGNQLHLLFAHASKPDEVDTAVYELKKQDILEYKNEEKLRKMVFDIMEIERYKEIVENATEILNEQDILIDEKHVKRPDKLIRTKKGMVVIDFKTGKPLRKHEQQVQNYCQVLNQMGMKNVEGYLIYANDLSMKKVS
jgi:ATP-dependent exoDNAse (exonuclease V) beta subunit